MKNKTVIVTGANSGMGLATAVELARREATVVMACRSAERGEAALRQVREASGSARVELMHCDLGSLDSIRSFANAVLERHPVLDVLVNNAGLMSLKRETTHDGFESQLGVNHLGHFLLTLRLLPGLRRSPQGRVVTVSSRMHRMGNIRWADPHLTRGYRFWHGYAQSKLANVLFTRGLAQRLRGTALTANCLDPGPVLTPIIVNRNTGAGAGLVKALAPFFTPPAQGADTCIWLATSNEVTEVSGDYFHRRAPVAMSRHAEDRELVERLWSWSEQQVGEEFPSP